jgi:hypothetical protein
VAKIALIIGLGVAGAFTGGLAYFGYLAFGAASLAGALATGFAVGATAGSLLGSVLFPIHLPNSVGPRIGDLTVTGSGPGPIPFGYGKFRYAGTIIWSPGLKEHSVTTKQSGKGGSSSSSTAYTYSASFAVSFGEGELSILKVWFDTKIVFDVTGGANTATTYKVPQLYTGTESQNPDPLIQGDKGVDATPAFRGLGYAVWEDFPLANFANRVPNVQALVQFKIGSL